MSEDNRLPDESIQNDLTDKFLTFKVGGQVYGIPIGHVVEIVRMQPITSMPELPHYAKGIINLRGRVVPVIDVNLRFGLPEPEYAERTCIVILQLENTQVGFIVDAVEEVRSIPAGLIEQPPVIRGNTGSYVIGVGKLEQEMVLLLDSRRLVSDDLGVLDAVCGA